MAIGKDKRKLVGRREAAIRLGITYDRFRYLERSRIVQGRLIAGAWMYDQADLDAVMPTIHRLKSDSREGELAAEAFKLFREGASDADVVIALRMAPARVRELRASYDPEAFVLSGEHVTELRRVFSLAGRSFERPSDFLAEVDELCKRDVRLTALETERSQRQNRRARRLGARDTMPAPPISH